MTIDLSLMRQRLEAKQAELQKNIRSLTEAHPEPVGAIEASEGPQDPEEVAVDFLETQQEQSLLVNEQALLTEVQNALERIPQKLGIDNPIHFHTRNQGCEWMRVAADTSYSVLLGFDQGRTRSAERVEQQVVAVELESREVLTHQMRRER